MNCGGASISRRQIEQILKRKISHMRTKFIHSARQPADLAAHLPLQREGVDFLFSRNKLKTRAFSGAAARWTASTVAGMSHAAKKRATEAHKGSS
jgi:hypothetical protein